MINLAFADLAHILSLPLRIYYYFTHSWPFGRGVCLFCFYLKYLNMYAAIVFLVRDVYILLNKLQDAMCNKNHTLHLFELTMIICYTSVSLIHTHYVVIKNIKRHVHF